MTKIQMYSQCTLERAVEDGVRMVDQVWIPAELAKIGKKLSIRKKDWAPPTWEHNWVVTSKGHTKSAAWLAERERDHLRQRRASDI